MTRNVLVVLVGLMVLVGCGKATPEELASLAAQGYYRHLIAGEYGQFLEGVAGSDSLSDEYREQLLTGYKQFVFEQRKGHKGINTVTVNNAKTDSTQQLVQVFLILQYADSTEEEIVVPMVEQQPGQWRMK